MKACLLALLLAVPAWAEQPVGPNTTVVADCVDAGSGCAAVELFVDGAAFGAEDTEEPFEWNLGTLTDGPHSLTATARDNAGNVSQPSLPLSVVVDSTAPSITLRITVTVEVVP